MKTPKDLYLSETNPEEYLRRARSIRLQRLCDIAGCFALLVMGACLMALWFAIEGFSIKW